MKKGYLRLISGKINCIWSQLNVDIEPFVVVLDTNGNVAIARKGNNLAEWKDGSFKKSYKRARAVLEGKRIKGGSKIYWLSRRYPNYKRLFLGAIGISGLSSEREHPFVRKLAGFRSHFHSRELPLDNFKNFIQVNPETFTK